MGEHIKCDGCHGPLQLRSTGPGGSRTAQAARYPARMCDIILEGIGTSVPEGGSSIPAPLPDLSKMVQVVVDGFKNLHCRLRYAKCGMSGAELQSLG